VEQMWMEEENFLTFSFGRKKLQNIRNEIFLV